MKIRFLTISFLLLFCQLVDAQNQRWRVQTLALSEDAVLRQAIVDSIVINSFWNTDELNRVLIFLNKEDFSSDSKKMLLSYFNRDIRAVDIDRIKKEVDDRMKKNLERYEREAIEKNVPFTQHYESVREDLIYRKLLVVSEQARSIVSPMYARILGWLDYEPAKAVIYSVLRDSLPMGEYAKNNKKEFELSCKLALARMGNKKYEKEIINEYSEIKIGCSRENLHIPIRNLFYINSRRSIDTVIQYSKKNIIIQRSHPDAHLGISTPPCRVTSVVLLSLSLVIEDYPLNFLDEADKFVFYTSPELIAAYAEDDFYKSQEKKLKQWLKDNADTYQINTERFFY